MQLVLCLLVCAFKLGIVRSKCLCLQVCMLFRLRMCLQVLFVCLGLLLLVLFGQELQRTAVKQQTSHQRHCHSNLLSSPENEEIYNIRIVPRFATSFALQLMHWVFAISCQICKTFHVAAFIATRILLGLRSSEFSAFPRFIDHESLIRRYSFSSSSSETLYEEYLCLAIGEAAPPSTC